MRDRLLEGFARLNGFNALRDNHLTPARHSIPILSMVTHPALAAARLRAAYLSTKPTQ